MPVIGSLARLSPRDGSLESLEELAPFLDEEPGRLTAAADGLGVVVGAGLSVVALLLGVPGLLLVALGGGFGAVLVARWGIVVMGTARRSRALGSASTIVGRAVLRTRVAPTAEGAAAFAAATDGRLGERLAAHVRRSRGTPRSGLGTFAAAWRETFPALHRALTLVDAAAEAPSGERDRALDRAMDAILDGTRDRASEGAESLRGPTTAVYAFGVLLPLALVAILPAASAAGVEATLPAVLVVYDVLLPLGLVAASGWLLSRRPVAFPPTGIAGSGGGQRWRSPAAGIGVAAVVWIGSGALLPTWTRPLAAAGIGAGVWLLVRYRPVIADRRRADELDAALPDALYLVGRRVADGVAVERAIADACDDLDGVCGEVFEAAARRQRQLRVDVETAFRGEYGALDAIASRRAESAARLLGVAARQGPPAGRALVETADHLEALGRVEREARRELSRVTSTLGNTAAFFGPLVGGATVALADSVGTTEALEGSAPATAELGLAVGTYVLAMAVILTALSVGLSRGLDRVTVGHRVGCALTLATGTYLVAFHATSVVAGGL